MADVTQLISFLATLFLVVTIPIYILFLITLYKNRNDELLKSAFFRLIFSLGFANLGQLGAILLGATLASYGWIPEFYIWMGGLSARLSLCATFGFGYPQIFGVATVAVNRFTAYILPLKHMKIWTDTLTRNIIISQWVVAVLLILPILFVFDYKLDVKADNRTIYFQWSDATQNLIYSMSTAGLMGGLLMIMIIILYAIIFTVALLRKDRPQQAGRNGTEKHALKMAAVGFICSIGLILFLGDLMVQNLAWILFQYNFLDQETNSMISNVGNSLFAAIDPYAMFLFSSTVRHRFVRLVCGCRKKSNNRGTIITVTPFSRR